MNVKTTFEMDGLFTEDDVKNRHIVMIQCRSCKKWSKHDLDTNVVLVKHKPCSYCGAINYDITSTRSVRSYNAETDNKRKPK